MEILGNSQNEQWRNGRVYFKKGLDSQNIAMPRSDHSFYRKFVFLKSQKRVMLRFLTEGDRQDLISLFQTASDEDLRCCKHDLKDMNLLNNWLDHTDSPRLLALAVVDLENNHLIAAGTLLRGKHSSSHIGELKLFIAKPFRNLGLGSTILDELMLLAAKESLHWVKAEVVTDQKQMIRALRNKGFQIRATLEDFFIRKDGMTHDLVLMMRAVNESTHEF